MKLTIILMFSGDFVVNCESIDVEKNFRHHVSLSFLYGCRKSQFLFLRSDKRRQFEGKDQVEASFFTKLFEINFFEGDHGTIVDIGSNEGQIFTNGYAAGCFKG